LRRHQTPVFCDGLRRAEDWVAWVEQIATHGSGLHIKEYLAGSFKRPVGEAGLSGGLLALSAAHLRGINHLRQKGVLTSGQAWLARLAEALKLPPRLLIRGLLPRLVGLMRRALPSVGLVLLVWKL
jgi:hypothetical protein